MGFTNLLSKHLDWPSFLLANEIYDEKLTKDMFMKAAALGPSIIKTPFSINNALFIGNNYINTSWTEIPEMKKRQLTISQLTDQVILF